MKPRNAGFIIPWHWTPDGKHVLASMGTFGGTTSMGLWSAGRGDQTEPESTLLSQPATNSWQGRFSPDGRWLAFVHVRQDIRRIAVARAAGGDPSTWAELPDSLSADKPRWSADGRTLYFIGTRARPFLHLWRIGFDPEVGRFVGPPEQLSHFERPDFEINPEMGNMKLSVTATKVFLTMRSTSGSIWMLDNVDR